MGTDMSNGSTFYVDPHGWVLNDAIPVTNPNIFVFGKPGRGKSAWVKAFLNRMFAFGYQALILGDPKDEYELMCRHFGVEPFAIGPGMPTRLNPLDPGPLATNWGQLDKVEQHRRQAIIVGRWLVLLRSLIGSQSIGDSKVAVGPTEEQVLKAVLVELTHTNADSRALRPIVIPQVWQQLHSPSDHLIAELRYPDRHTFLDDTRLLRDAVAQLISGVFAGIFDAPTTVTIDWNAPIQSLSLSRLMPLGDDAVGMALMCLNSWGTAMRQVSGRRRINVRDEVWRQLRLGTGAVSSFDADLRLSRSHGDIEIANAHKPSDYLVPRPSTFALLADTPGRVRCWVAGTRDRVEVSSCSSPQECRDGRTCSGPGNHQRRGQPAVAHSTARLRVGCHLATSADRAALGPGHGSSADRGGHVHQRRPGP